MDLQDTLDHNQFKDPIVRAMVSMEVHHLLEIFNPLTLADYDMWRKALIASMARVVYMAERSHGDDDGTVVGPSGH